jgi:hypothetical protein
LKGLGEEPKMDIQRLAPSKISKGNLPQFLAVLMYAIALNVSKKPNEELPTDLIIELELNLNIRDPLLNGQTN